MFWLKFIKLIPVEQRPFPAYGRTKYWVNVVVPKIPKLDCLIKYPSVMSACVNVLDVEFRQLIQPA